MGPIKDLEEVKEPDEVKEPEVREIINDIEDFADGLFQYGVVHRHMKMMKMQILAVR